MSEFKREERYIVVKLKHLAGLQVAPLRNFLRDNRVPTLDCVVVEKDWPEYERVWRSIERRMTSQPIEDFDRVTAERDSARAEIAILKHPMNSAVQARAERDAALADLASANSDKEAYAQNAIDLRNRVDALQQRLTAADERADVLEGLLRKAAWHVRREGTDADIDAIDAALKPAEGGGDEA